MPGAILKSLKALAHLHTRTLEMQASSDSYFIDKETEAMRDEEIWLRLH